MEHKIVAAVAAARDNWDKVSVHITDNDLSPEGILVWDTVKKYYDRDKKAKSVDLELLKKQVLRRVENNKKHVEALSMYLDRVALKDVSDINVVSEVLNSKRKNLEMLIAEQMAQGQRDSYKNLLKELEAIDLHDDLDTGVDEEYQGVEVMDLIGNFSEDRLIRVAPESLNRRLNGGALPGQHILVAALPEHGKTLTVMTMLAGFVHHNHKTLMIGNEDPMVSLVMRFLTNITGRTQAEIVEDPVGTQEIANKRGYGNAIFAGLSPGTMPEIESLVIKHKPDVLIVDQLRNVQSKSENRTTQLEAVARGMRDIARKYQLLAVSVTQAAESARNKLVLDMGDIDGSNIGMPGACDVMLMMGMNETGYQNDERTLTLAKNKITGDHGHWTVGISKEYSRIVDPSEMLKR